VLADEPDEVNPSMGTIANPVSSNALSLLTGPNGPLSALGSQLSQKILQSASPADVIALSDEALQLQATETLFGTAPTEPAQSVDPLYSLLSSLYGVTQPPQSSTPNLLNTIG